MESSDVIDELFNFLHSINVEYKRSEVVFINIRMILIKIKYHNYSQ